MLFISIPVRYNPFAWLIRYSIRQNLEFIADRQVVGNGLNKKDYQYHLLKVIGQARNRLANNFNFYSLKKRITMMNKMRPKGSLRCDSHNYKALYGAEAQFGTLIG